MKAQQPCVTGTELPRSYWDLSYLGIAIYLLTVLVVRVVMALTRLCRLGPGVQCNQTLVVATAINSIRLARAVLPSSP